MRSEKLIGLPVVHIDQGKQYGTIQGIVLNHAQKCVAGFLIRSGGWRKRRLLAIENVHAMGEQAVTINAEDALQEIHGDSPLHQCWNDALSLPRMKVLTTTGTGLGTVDDFEFSIDGTITRILLRPSTRPRRNVISLGGHFLRSFGQDAVIVEAEAQSILTQNETETNEEKMQETESTSPRFLHTLTTAFKRTTSPREVSDEADSDEQHEERPSQ